MEGKYWKRRIETVVAEYKKWRAFFMEKVSINLFLYARYVYFYSN